ncbi:MAG: thioredoxin family protein [Ignavibacteriaceae bacterium]
MTIDALGEITRKKGLTYPEYLQKTIEEIANTDVSLLDENALEKFNFKKLNLHRSSRIEKTYKVSEELKSEIQKINNPQLWMILSETWCGDSAQNIPHLYLMAAHNPNIDVRMILRDSNPDIMDKYLTNGTRSIPILIALDNEGNELFRWGSRPKAGQDLVNELKAQGLEKKQWQEKLHLWYARNRGAEIEKEILEILRKM